MYKLLVIDVADPRHHNRGIIKRITLELVSNIYIFPKGHCHSGAVKVTLMHGRSERTAPHSKIEPHRPCSDLKRAQPKSGEQNK